MSVQTLSAGRYRIERELGLGGMAAVYLAHDQELDRPVAVKLLAANLAGDESFRKRFVREARVAAKLSHPNIVRVFDSGEADGRPFIVMEYVEGESLAEALRRRGKFPPDEAVELVLQICEGLEHAHANGLVHRDVKPGNLLLREDGVLKIADFGIARATEATKLTQVGTVLGTAAYLSPEQAAGTEVTPAADLYSLGVVFYELLTGRTPYVVESLPQLAVQQREGAITPLGSLEPVSATLEGAVTRCLAFDPAARPGSAAELARELTQPEAPTEPLETRVVPTQPATGIHWHRSWSWAALVGAVALIALVVALVATDSRRPRTGPVPVEPVSRGSTPADEARNLSDWLRRHSG